MLKSGHLFGAGLDATDPEPLPEKHPLFSLDNCGTYFLNVLGRIRYRVRVVLRKLVYCLRIR